jgi:hypothetical protein
VLVDAEGLIAAWNKRQARRMPLLFAPIGAALASRHHFLWVYCPRCRTTRNIDLRTLDRYRDAAVPSLLAVVPATCTVRGTRAAVKDQHR